MPLIFKPGPLSASEAAELSRLSRVADNLTRISVTAPLSIQRRGDGVTAISIAPQAGGGGTDTSFLAVLVAKCYVNVTGGPAGTAATVCAPDTSCDGGGDPSRYWQYSWIMVTDAGDNPGPPCPITYTEQGYSPGVTCGGPDCFPAYHVNNIDLPIWYGGADLPCCGEDAGDGRTDVVAQEAVFRLRPGAGDYFLIEEPPRWEIVRKTSDELVDVDGILYYPGELLQYIPAPSGTWAVIKDVLLVDAGTVTP